jgi:hypothetical protein
MLRRILFTLALLLGTLVTAPRYSGSQLCSCGIQPSQEVYYDAPTADRFSPDPRVITISKQSGLETIRVAVDVELEQKTLQEIIIHTTNRGRNWVREGLQTKSFQEFSRSPILYRVPVHGVGLERSPDDGKHWRKVLLNINRESTPKSQQQSVGTDSSELRLEVAAVHPKNADTIFGCFSAVPQPREPVSRLSESRDLPGIYVSTDGGDHWSLFSADIGRHSIEEPCLLGINPSNPEIMAARVRSGVVTTRDGGKNWTPVGDQSNLEKPAHLKGYEEQAAQWKAKGLTPARWPFAWTSLIITQVAFDPGNADVMYLVTNKGLYKTQDGARTWCLLDTGPRRLFGVRSFYIDVSNPGRLYVGTDNKVLVSEDRGCHFDILFESNRMTDP